MRCGQCVRFSCGRETDSWNLSEEDGKSPNRPRKVAGDPTTDFPGFSWKPTRVRKCAKVTNGFSPKILRIGDAKGRVRYPQMGNRPKRRYATPVRKSPRDIRAGAANLRT